MASGVPAVAGTPFNSYEMLRYENQDYELDPPSLVCGIKYPGQFVTSRVIIRQERSTLLPASTMVLSVATAGSQLHRP